MEAGVGAVIVEGRSVFVTYTGLEQPAYTATWLSLVRRRA